jgi:uncharacterized protein
MEREVEHGLVLTICHTLLKAPAKDVYLATVEDGDDIVGCSWRTPPHKAGITRAPEPALRCLVDDLIDRFGDLPMVLGPEPDVRIFAGLWSERLGTSARPGKRQRVYEIRELSSVKIPPGLFRPAVEEDTPIVIPWFRSFEQEVEATVSRDPVEAAHERINSGRLFLWQDEQITCMAARTQPTPRGAGINYVYTPPEFRRRGYASACVAALTGRLLAQGRTHCFLFTDLANTSSNAIYQAIGYRPVCDMSDYVLASPTGHQQPT